MSDASLATMLRGLRDPAGVGVLLQYLGFPDPARRQPRLRQLPAAVRELSATRRDTLAAFVVELRGGLDAAVLREVAARLRGAEPACHCLVVARDEEARNVALACDVLGTGLHYVVLDTGLVRASDLDLLAEIVPAAGETGTAMALRLSHAFDRSRVGQRFFRDVVATRNMVARGWTGLPISATAER
jgi:hypothetical protein